LVTLRITDKGLGRTLSLLRWSVILGINFTIIPKLKTDKPVRIKNGVCQSDKLARNNPSGTPSTEATENAAITNPIARPLLESGITSPIIARINADVRPPKIPEITLANNRIG